MKVSHLWKSYDGVTVLQDVSLDWQPGITCIMGASGAGKTTLLRILLGLETADSGEMTGFAHCSMAAAFQEPRLLPQLSAMGNLRFALGDSLDTAHAMTLLSQLGLGEEGDKPASLYSGGMAKRLSLSRALLSPASALVLDEPFSGLDEDSRGRAIAAVRQYSVGRAVLVVTHDADDAVALEAEIITLSS